MKDIVKTDEPHGLKIGNVLNLIPRYHNPIKRFTRWILKRDKPTIYKVTEVTETSFTVEQ